MAKNLKPTISIIMPVYNAAKFLGPCLESIQKQTFQDWELVAIDDASTDNSYQLLSGAAKTDNRIRVFRNRKNRGVAVTLNRAIKLAQAGYLARMDADDIMARDRLAKQKSFLERHPETVVVGGQCELMNIDGTTIGFKNYPLEDWEIRKMIFTFSPASHPSIMINRCLVPKQFEWYNPYACPAEDIDLYFRLFGFGKFTNLNRIVTKYRLYSQSTSFKNPKLNFVKTQRVRQNAIRRFGYQPGLRARLVNFCEITAIKTLPDKMIYPVYLFMRGLVEIKLTMSFNLTKLTQAVFYDFDFNPQRQLN